MCSDMVELKLMGYDRVAASFSKYFDQDELQYIVERKADIELVKRLQDTKATKHDIKF